MSVSRCAVVAVIGAPNAGKSSLVNALVGAKISIVTHKVQTTRARVRGVAVENETQLVLTDTPGIFSPRRSLDRAMVSAAWESIEETDDILFVVDAAAYLAAEGRGASAASQRSADDTNAILAGLKERGARATLVLNKIDSVERVRLLALTRQLSGEYNFAATFMISASTGDGVADLKAHLVRGAPCGEWLYPEDQLSDIAERLMAAEITREKLFLRLHQELPYETTVETENWSRTKKGELRIEQVIYVARETQKGIVLGAGGRTLKSIGTAARQDISVQLGEPVHLFLFVKVREDWMNEPARLRGMGLEPGR
jgi:GTP-binding protein Era